MLFNLIIFAVFFFVVKQFGEDKDCKFGFFYSFLLSISIIVLLTLFELDSQHNGVIAGISGLGFYSGFKAGKAKLKKEMENEFIDEKMQSVYCKYCNNIVNVSEEQLKSRCFTCTICNKENLI